MDTSHYRMSNTRFSIKPFLSPNPKTILRAFVLAEELKELQNYYVSYLNSTECNLRSCLLIADYTEWSWMINVTFGIYSIRGNKTFPTQFFS